jgi:cell division protein FtsX
MNEKIKQLAEQAIQEVAPGVEYKIMLSPAVEKFAELIVKECAERIAHNEKFNWLDAAQAAKDLKEHFGVEL